MQQDNSLSAAAEKMIRQLAENEKSVAVLYARYAEIFPEAQSLWSFLAREEKGHAELLDNLLKPGNAAEIDMPLEGVRLAEAIKIGEFVAELRKQAKPGSRLTLARALTNAVGIESNILEAKLLEGETLFATEWTFQSVSTVLFMETQNHLTLVEKALEEVKRKLALPKPDPAVNDEIKSPAPAEQDTL